MSTLYIGDAPSGGTLYIPFTTYGGTNGESITCTGLAVTDIEIFKNGVATARASDSGYTLLDTDGIDFAGITGLHGFSLDLSDNTDAGFYAVGSTYWVVVSAITVDSQTVSFVPVVFRIAPAESVAGYRVTDAGALAGTVQSAADLADFADTGYNPTTHVAQSDMTYIHGTALTETAGQLAGRFSDFFDQASATFTVATALSSFKATGFSTHDAAAVVTALGTGTTLTAIPWNAAWDTQVQSECTDALNAYDPPTAAELTSALNAIASYIDTEVAAILVDTGTTIPALIAALNDPTAAAISTQVASDLATAHGAGSWTTGAGGDATEAKQDTIISTLATIRGADSDTLETLSDQLDTLVPGAAVNVSGKSTLIVGETT